MFKTINIRGGEPLEEYLIRVKGAIVTSRSISYMALFSAESRVPFAANYPRYTSDDWEFALYGYVHTECDLFKTTLVHSSPNNHAMCALRRKRCEEFVGVASFGHPGGPYTCVVFMPFGEQKLTLTVGE